MVYCGNGMNNTPTALLATLMLCALLATPVYAADFELLSVSALIKVGEKRVLGKVQPESFREYDVMAAFRMPTNLGLDTRLLVTAGAIRGAGKTAAVAAAIPAFAITTQDGRFAIDTGLGLALISEYRFGRQDYGGPLQFALTLGGNAQLFEHFGLGYRFLHYSDAGLYGPGSTGADSHMVELIYRY